MPSSAKLRALSNAKKKQQSKNRFIMISYLVNGMVKGKEVAPVVKAARCIMYEQHYCSTGISDKLKSCK